MYCNALFYKTSVFQEAPPTRFKLLFFLDYGFTLGPPKSDLSLDIFLLWTFGARCSITSDSTATLATSTVLKTHSGGRIRNPGYWYYIGNGRGHAKGTWAFVDTLETFIHSHLAHMKEHKILHISQ